MNSDSSKNHRVSRQEMVKSQIADRGIRDPRVLDAMATVPRENFLPENLRHRAFEDRALPIDSGQTISQPYIVAFMTEALQVGADHRVLEIGTGTGYQAAILAKLARWVYTIERIEPLSLDARHRLKDLGVENVEFKIGDGTLGWPEEAPFDRIIVTAGGPRIVDALVSQLTEDGRMIVPIGDEGAQHLTCIERIAGKTIERHLIPVRFVRLIGKHGYAEGE